MAAITRSSSGRFVAGGGGGGGGARTITVRVPGAAKKAARKVGGAALAAAQSEKHTITALVAAAAYGYAKRENMDLPKVDSLGLAGTYGAALWMAGRFKKSRTLSHAATGLLCIAVSEAVQGSERTSGTGRRPGRAPMMGALDVDDDA